MSGIAGILSLDGTPVVREAMDAILEVLAPRGPDETGVWIDGAIALGHRMLRATPEAANEHQPLSGEHGRFCLVADARVDNREVLASEFRARGVRLRTETDAEFILRAYEVWGEECPAKILGDFAFALWDRDRHRLFCARDPIGVKPLCYLVGNGRLYIASEPTALFAGGAGPRKPNLAMLCLYLLDRFEEPEETLDQGVRRLPGGHRLTVTGGRIVTSRYWHVDPGRTVRCSSDEAYAEQFLDLFRDSVRARLRSRTPVGILLSGGLDSSSVACVAQQVAPAASPSGVEGFAMVFGDLPCDERPYIDAVTHAANLRTTCVMHEEASDALRPEHALTFRDALYLPTLFMVSPALRAAESRGVRVMLDGAGGDDLLAASYLHLADLLRQGRLGRLWQQLRHDASPTGYSRATLLLHSCLRPLLPRLVRTLLRKLLRSNAPPPWINPECLRKSGASDRLRATPSGPRFPGISQQFIHDELTNGFNAKVVLVAEDRLLSQFSMEGRHPFLDRRIVEFLLSVPEEQRWSGPWPKAILRRAMKNILPESVRLRTTKAEFTGVQDQAFRGRHSNEVRALFQPSMLAELGVLLIQRFLPRLDAYLAGRAAPWEQIGCGNAIVLELWCRANLCSRE